MPFKFREPEAGLVSVVIPSYNAERFLGESLESALAQTYSNIEIIVVDDGSTDGSVRLIESYGDRLKAVSGPHHGGSAARNRGTALARGEFIQYLDADDLLTPNSVEQSVASLLRTHVDVAYSEWETLIEVKSGEFQLGERVVRRIEDFHAVPEMAILVGFWIPLSGLMYRRSIVEKVGCWKEDLPVMQDGRFFQDAVLAGARFTYVPHVGVRVRVHRASLSRCISDGAVKSVGFRNACDLQAGLEAKGELSKEERRILAQFYNSLAPSLFHYDRLAFCDCMERVYAVEPGFRASWPKVAHLASGLIGFRAAGALLRTQKQLRTKYGRSRKRR